MTKYYRLGGSYNLFLPVREARSPTSRSGGTGFRRELSSQLLDSRPSDAFLHGREKVNSLSLFF